MDKMEPQHIHQYSVARYPITSPLNHFTTNEIVTKN